MTQGMGIGFSIGFIMFWNRLEKKLPKGWVICDGTEYTLNIKETNTVNSNNQIELSNIPFNGNIAIKDLNPGDYVLKDDVVTFKAPIKEKDVIEMRFDVNVKTPNLINAFIYGGKEPGAIGGNKEHDHGNTGLTVLTTQQIPSHNHTYSFPNNATVKVTAGEESLTLKGTTSSNATSGNTGGGQGHDHTTKKAEHMPPYYTLIPVCFIGFEE